MIPESFSDSFFCDHLSVVYSFVRYGRIENKKKEEYFNTIKNVCSNLSSLLCCCWWCCCCCCFLTLSLSLSFLFFSLLSFHSMSIHIHFVFNDFYVFSHRLSLLFSFDLHVSSGLHYVLPSMRFVACWFVFKHIVCI